MRQVWKGNPTEPGPMTPVGFIFINVDLVKTYLEEKQVAQANGGEVLSSISTSHPDAKDCSKTMGFLFTPFGVRYLKELK